MPSSHPYFPNFTKMSMKKGLSNAFNCLCFNLIFSEFNIMLSINIYTCLMALLDYCHCSILGYHNI